MTKCQKSCQAQDHEVDRLRLVGLLALVSRESMQGRVPPGSSYLLGQNLSYMQGGCRQPRSALQMLHPQWLASAACLLPLSQKPDAQSSQSLPAMMVQASSGGAAGRAPAGVA